MEHLHLIKWQDENGKHHRFKLMDHIAPSWRVFGILLGITTAELDHYMMESQYDSRLCLVRIFSMWLDGNSFDYSPTWSGLYELLRDARHYSVASALQQAVEHIK